MNRLPNWHGSGIANERFELNTTMTKTVELPMLDAHGISPIVLEAMSKGATSANHPNDPNLITLTFSKEADAKAFKAAINAHVASREPVKAAEHDAQED